MVRLSELLRALDERGDPSYDLDDIEGGDHIDDHGAYRRPGPAAERSVVLVDTRQAVASALLVLASAQTIAVDCEGIDLDRHGKLCLLALSPSVEKVYLFDVSVLGRDAFTSEAAGVTVKGLLESSAVRKLLYDVRADSDALYHQFGVRLAGILDLQIAGGEERGAGPMHADSLLQHTTSYHHSTAVSPLLRPCGPLPLWT